MAVLKSATALLFAGVSAPWWGIAPTHAATTDVPHHYAAPLGSEGSRTLDAWWVGFESPELSQLIDAAQLDNLDVQAASARWRAAQAQVQAARSALRPSVDLGVNASQYAGHSAAGTAHETDASGLLSASYEWDLNGKNRAQVSGATALAAAAEADQAAVRISTEAALAATYFTVLSLRERSQLARADLAFARQMLEVVEARFAARAIAAGDVASQRVAVANAAVAIADLQLQETAALNALAVLAGRQPEDLTIAAADLSAIASPAVSAGLPAELLQRRPDIVAAERALAAAEADVAVARAALFPSITLTAAGGVQNPAVAAAVTTLTGTGAALTLGAQIVQSVFDGGRRRAQRDVARARADELLINYQSSIRNALVDVETALAARHTLSSEEPSQIEAVAQSERALALIEARYRAGLSDLLTVLDAERTVIAARAQAAQYRLAVLLNAVGLVKALGGGWQPTPLPATH
jgi:outer membrane protein, multidrug efflux system